WKPNPKSWSIAQCLDHLITTNELYFPIFDGLKTGTVPSNFFARFGIMSGYFGRLLRRTLGPDVVRKAKSPANFQPSQSDLGGDIVSRFLAHQEVLLQAYADLPNQDLSQIIMISPAASFVTYSIEDALHILAGHEERHLRQAQRVMQEANFPIKSSPDTI
ncbi:MAG: DinB family protein, partial [Bacteroidota bacterium]